MRAAGARLPRAMALSVLAVALTGADRPKSPWAEEPTRAQVMAAAPAAARRPGSIGGRAAMQCKVEPDGRLAGCRVIREMPSGQGYGAALLSLAPLYRHGPRPPAEAVVTADWFRADTPAGWVRRPSPGDLAGVFPVAAVKRGKDGKAVIDCVATTQGALVDCVVLSESPAGLGFGGAALALTPQMQMRPAQLMGQPTPSAVRIPINWSGVAVLGAPGGTGRRLAPNNLGWAEAPTYADVQAAYPKRAREERVGGHATLGCDMTAEGTLKACEVLRQEPKTYGFGQAAQALASRFRFPIDSQAEADAAKRLKVHLPFVFAPAMLQGEPANIGKPSWVGLPTDAELRAAFGAELKGTQRATIDCRVEPGGALGDCRVASEEPAGGGAAKAALALSSKFRISTWTADGLPTVGARVRVPVRYEGGS